MPKIGTPAPGQTGAGAGNQYAEQPVDNPPSAAAQGWRDRSHVVDLRDEIFRRDLVRLHKLGPRAYYQMLADLGAQRLIRTEIEALVRRYSRIDPTRLAAAAGDRWPPP
jgi:hypothetical protein